MIEEIIKKSNDLDFWDIEKNFSEKLIFKIPQKYESLSREYSLRLEKISNLIFDSDSLVIYDQVLKPFLEKNNINILGNNFFPILCSESKTKTINFASSFLEKIEKEGYKKVYAIGGGTILDFSSFIAMKLNVELVLIPTTIVGMCDASIGGKVRLNDTTAEKFFKHAFKSRYYPREILIISEFLKSLTHEQIKVGLAETFKIALVQSDSFLNFLISEKLQPFENSYDLKKIVLSSIYLKKISLDIDPDENDDGSGFFIHFAHDKAVEIETNSSFNVSHGEAVLMALKFECEKDNLKKSKIESLFKKFEINFS